MDWLFGCFGGAGKKARKPDASQKAFQRSFQPLPEKVLPATSISITGFTAKEEGIACGITSANGKDSIQAGDCASSALAKEAEGTIQESSERTPEKPKKGDPWSQLEDLEEELEDLRKQIEIEALDARKIKEEVTFLRSCGTLLQTPAELRKRDKTLETRQDETSTRGWHSWLVLSSPSPSKQLCTLPSNSQHAVEPILCPADPTHNVPHDVQSPIIENKKNRVKSTFGSPLMLEHGLMPQNIWHMQEKADKSITRSQNSVGTLGHQFEDLDFASRNNRPRSPCKGPIAGVPSALAKQCFATPRNENFKSLGGAVIASTRDNSELHVRCTENPCEYRPFNLKNFEVSKATLSENETKESISTLDHVEQAHNINAVRAPCIYGEIAAPWNDVHNTTFEMQGMPKLSKHRYQMYESSDCAPCTVSQSISTMEMTENEKCQSSSFHDHVLISDQKHHKMEHEESGDWSTFFQNEDLKFDIVRSTFSISTDSEETLTDLSTTVESLVPSETPQSRLESITSCEGEDRSSSFYAEETASSSLYSHGSTQNSVAQACRRTAQAARYDSEFYESEDNLLFANSTSHEMALCSHLHNAEKNEQKRYISQENQSLTKTPFKVLHWEDTPEPPRPFGVRSRPTSPVLTPVKTAFQWRHLKRKVGNTENAFESNDMIEAKNGTRSQSHPVHVLPDRSISESTEGPKWKEGWDENEELDVWGAGDCMSAQNARMEICKVPREAEITPNNMSLSNWLMTPQPVKGGNPENSTTLLRSSNVAHAETESSPWAREHIDDLCGEFTQSFNGPTEPCPPARVDLSLSNWLDVPFKQNEANGCTAGLAIEQSPARRWNERPILGLITGEMNSNSVTREVHWDGKGIPNTTTKYKEDQRVNWHATPFEARLERALTRQGKLIEEAETSPVPNRLKSLQ
ncbi:hypothetical protein GOP47_0003794 [Adiantum capillus-veneris]|uniref:Protein JASON n=1 Tax=Adiantum capillus-veneris TaxID=13818 RepID=A0A9D4V6A3_ADICA|nr:hypothetical protein GOP47_0003794 [Adiantum capillus-veneris]